MNTVGIIAEYNPFHNGHAYQIQYAKEVLHADAVIVVMSGNFTQRGIPALVEKEYRTRCALSSGADLVIELPAIFATASAEAFATAGVCTLAATGLVDYVLFGCETDDISLFQKAADLLCEEPQWFKDSLNQHLTLGISFAQARALALAEQIPEDFISKPNNILGIEYIKAIKKYHLALTPCCLKRNGMDYHDLTLSNQGAFASASGIRNQIALMGASSDLAEHIPDKARSILTPLIDSGDYLLAQDLSQLLLYKLLSENDFSIYADCNENISNRINHTKYDFCDFDSYCLALKSKDLAYTRVSRILNHIALGLTKDLFSKGQKYDFCPYLHILGYSKCGSLLLSQLKASAKVPYFLACKQGISQLSSDAKEILTFDIKCTDFYHIMLNAKTHKSYPNDFQKKFTLGNLS